MNTKIKYLSGNKKDQVIELDEVKAKSLVEDGLAELVVEDESPLTAALKTFETKAFEIAERALTDATAKALDNVAKGVTKASSIKVGSDRELEDRTGGFSSIGHFMYEVQKSGINMSNPTPAMQKHITADNRRIKAAGATPYNSEGSLSLTAGTGDGAVIPVQYSEAIFQMYGEQDDLMELAFPFAMNSLAAHLPVLANYNRANTTAANGVVVTEPGEAQIIPNSKTVWEQRIFTLVKEAIIVPVSNEALDDNNVGLANAIAAQAIWQLRKKINGAILQGSSVSTSCVGIIGGAATKITGRTTNGTVTFADLIAMYASFAHQDANYGGAYWLCHPTVLPALSSTTIGNFPAFFAPGGAQSERPLTILGRPIIVTGWCKPLGTSGDLLLVDPKKYIVGYKGGVNSFVSPHVYAASDQTGFRFTQRVNGQQGLTGLITLEDGTNTVSPFVELGQVGGLS
jgi:HK97 family phage major capsid protein